MAESQQVQLEKFVLGAIIWGKHPHYLERLIEDDFTDEKARAVFVELYRRFVAGEDTGNTIMLAPEMDKQCLFISECSDVFSLRADVESVLEAEVSKLITVSDIRNVYNGCQVIVRGIKARDIDTPDKALAELQLLQDATVSRHRVLRETLVGTSMMDGFKQVERNLSAGRIQLGFPRIDAWIGGGITLGEFVIIAARTNVGKSIMSIYPVINTARRNKNVLLCSNEMTDAQMAMRMVANISQVEMGVIEKVYKGTGEQYQAIAKASFELRNLPIVMLPDCYHVSQITEVLDRRRRAGIPISLVVLDLVQRMKSDNPKVIKGYDSITEVSRALQALAKRYNCVIISMAQVNRAGSTADRILVSHIEGSGALEQDADKIFLMYGDKSEKDVRLLELAKNRTGRVGDEPFRLRLEGAKMNFTETI